MNPHLPTTPFGRRTLSLAQVASQAGVKACAPHKAAHKWDVFKDVCAAKARLGLSDRALAVLNALLSFHPDTTLTRGIIVFPSNRQLLLRANGMAPATLRRHLGALVEAGLILRRDSPNGKRYARRDRDGAIETAYGFDLSPLVARQEELAEWAHSVRAEAQAMKTLRERITLLRRDIVKMIAAGLEAGACGRWEALHAAYIPLAARLPRARERAELLPLAQSLAALADEALNLLEIHANTPNLSASESRGERHIQESHTETILDSEPLVETRRPSNETLPPLPTILRACPDIADYARSGVAQWPDLLAAAEVARAALAVSPSAWREARAIMGERPAAVAVAAILQRGAGISSPGGYLRQLTRKAQARAFRVSPMLMALVAARNRAEGLNHAPERIAVCAIESAFRGR